MAQRVAVLGTGKIGEALVSGLLRAGKPASEVLVTARQPLARTSSTSASVRHNPPAIRGMGDPAKS